MVSGQSAAAAISSETDAVHSSPEYDGRHFSVEERMLVVGWISICTLEYLL
eukprot:m.1210315 g.1210315  ORF g.1210315 m.1210315 type:complete len:51 (+) comp24592_c0_seq21:1204-1356(+)